MIERLIRKELAGFRAERILDVGPGFGNFSRVSAEVTGAAEITFVDTNQDVLRFQEEECRLQGSRERTGERVGARLRARVRARPILMTIGKDPLAEEGMFDLVHCQEVLEHLEDPGSLLRSLVGRMNPGARMIVTVPTARSERWLRLLNPGYMRNEPHGHVQEFTASSLRQLLTEAGLEIVTFLPAQPHYFIGHTWLFGTRMAIEGSTGKVLTGGVRGAILGRLISLSRAFFLASGIGFWSRVFPRNFFVLARREGA